MKKGSGLYCLLFRLSARDEFLQVTPRAAVMATPKNVPSQVVQVAEANFMAINSMQSCHTKLRPEDVDHPGLAEAIRLSLTSQTHLQQAADEKFRRAISHVIHGIRNNGRFDFLRRFVAHGSLLPSWETQFTDAPHALNNDELSTLVDFISGHMVSKFQGALAEILSTSELELLINRLRRDGVVPTDAMLILGSRIRCLPRRRYKQMGGKSLKGIQGPDGAVVSFGPKNRIGVHVLIEIKSMYVNPSALRRQFKKHLAAIRRGVRIDGKWFCGNQVQTTRTRDKKIFIVVHPSSWRLTRRFSLDASEDGIQRLVMDDEQTPPMSNRCVKDKRHDWHAITLAWSYEALRAAAFNLVREYIAEVGEDLARNPDPEIPLRTDMTPAQAGPNDLLHQLHIAIARQADTELDANRRKKTIELYNVLAFGWALGHDYRDEKGRPDMMYPADLDRLLGQAQEVGRST